MGTVNKSLKPWSDDGNNTDFKKKKKKLFNIKLTCFLWNFAPLVTLI